MENNKINKKGKITLIIFIVLYLIAAIGYWFIPNVSMIQKGIFFGGITFSFIFVIILSKIIDSRWVYNKKNGFEIGLYKNRSLYVWKQLKKRYLSIAITKSFSDLASSFLIISSLILLDKESKNLETLSEFLTSTGFILACITILPMVSSFILFLFSRVTLAKIFGHNHFSKDVVITKNIYWFAKESRINWFIWFHQLSIFGTILTFITYLDIEKNNPNILETETKN